MSKIKSYDELTPVERLGIGIALAFGTVKPSRATALYAIKPEAVARVGRGLKGDICDMIEQLRARWRVESGVGDRDELAWGEAFRKAEPLVYLAANDWKARQDARMARLDRIYDRMEQPHA